MYSSLYNLYKSNVCDNTSNQIILLLLFKCSSCYNLNVNVNLMSYFVYCFNKLLCFPYRFVWTNMLKKYCSIKKTPKTTKAVFLNQKPEIVTWCVCLNLNDRLRFNLISRSIKSHLYQVSVWQNLYQRWNLIFLWQI